MAIRTDKTDGATVSTTTNVTASDLNAIGTQVNTNTTNITALQASVTTNTSAIAAIQALPAGLRTLAGGYRPLQGNRSDITSAFTAGNSYATSGLIPWTSAWPGKYRICGTHPVGLFSNAWCMNNNCGLGNSFGTVAPQPITIEFWSNAADLRIHFDPSTFTNADVWALCDDQRITTGWIHVSAVDVNNVTTWKLTQSSQVWHKWRICVSILLAGVSIESTATIVPTTGAPKIAVIGDSITAGFITVGDAVAPGTNGSIACGASWGEFEQVTGMDVWRNAIGGTGYVNDNGGGTGYPFGSVQRMAALAAYPPMDAVVCFGSDNDNYSNPFPVTSAAQACWAAIKQAQPTAALIVIGVQNQFAIGTWLYAVNLALKNAAQSNSNVSAFIDICSGYPVIYGSGTTTSPSGDGNADVFIDGLSGHPTHLGHRAWGEELTKLVSAVAIPYNKMTPTIISDHNSQPAGAPVWQTTSAASASSAGTSASTTVPTGVAAADVLVAILTVLTASTLTVTPPTGWTQKGTTLTNSAAGVQTQTFWYRATGADTGSYTFTLSSSQIWTIDIMRYSGAHPSGDPFDDFAAAASTAAVTTTPSVSIVTTDQNRLVAWFGISVAADAAHMSVPAAFVTQEWSGTRSKVYDTVQFLSGTTGPQTGSTTHSGGDQFNVVLYALKA